MSYLPVIELLDGMIADTAGRANVAAAAIVGFDAIGAGGGVGVRLALLAEVRDAVVRLGLQEHEARGVCS